MLLNIARQKGAVLNVTFARRKSKKRKRKQKYNITHGYGGCV